jgi:hypothetical protein
VKVSPVPLLLSQTVRQAPKILVAVDSGSKSQFIKVLDSRLSEFNTSQARRVSRLILWVEYYENQITVLDALLFFVFMHFLSHCGEGVILPQESKQVEQ